MQTASERRRITVRGIVQGVGFRPFVYLQARDHRLTGFVGNNAHGVVVEVEGASDDIEGFLDRLRHAAPPLSRVDDITHEPVPTRGDQEFVISPSTPADGGRSTLVSPDSAVCGDCLREMSAVADRRHSYPFTNCTNCGPRFTITQDIPYDRANTTMSRFPLCEDCTREYHDPTDRRFHAQPNACPMCGPKLVFLPLPAPHPTASEAAAPPSADPPSADPADALRQAAQLLAAGAILGVKGLGGYHLACAAADESAVAELRRRKTREARPLAVMVTDLDEARLLCHVSEDEAELLQSVERPIVLMRRRTDAPVTLHVAPETGLLGVMLAYTPLHHLLLAAYRTAAPDRATAALVMTSANAADDPILYRDPDARRLLPAIADAALVHDRDIHMRCDDSLVRVVQGKRQTLRRARGYAPAPLRLREPAPVPLLACGAHNKNTFCLIRGDQAFLSHHIGALRSPDTLRSLQETVSHYQRLFDVNPQAIVHDYHPRYQSTRFALQSDIPLKIGVQHHEAHIASVIAEHGVEGPVIGVAADGTGYGTDGTVWGGEFLVGDLVRFERFAHLEPVPLAGGEAATKRPWVMGYIHAANALGPDFTAQPLPFAQRWDQEAMARLDRVVKDPALSPRTSSMGRLFDAASSLVGLVDESRYEGQAAVLLEERATAFAEQLAGRTGAGRLRRYPAEVAATGGPVPLGALVRALVEDVAVGRPREETAYRFHLSVADLITSGCEAAREHSGVDTVALSGGVFQNALLLGLVRTTLSRRGFTVFTNERVPPNDGGISLGQAAIAAARLGRLNLGG